MKVRITKQFGNKRVLDGFTAEIKEGEIFCLLGPSGAGKTTLLNILAGLTSYEGEIEGVSQKVGYVFQENRLLPHLSAKGNLLYTGASQAEAEEILGLVGLSGSEDTPVKNLSGGEKRRVALARAFLSKAPLLLLDEPFSALDTALKIGLCKTFAHIWERERPTVVLVTHDIEEAFMLGHTVAVTDGGRLVKEVRVQREGLPSVYGVDSEEKREILNTLLTAKK